MGRFTRILIANTLSLKVNVNFDSFRKVQVVIGAQLHPIGQFAELKSASGHDVDYSGFNKQTWGFLICLTIILQIFHKKSQSKVAFLFIIVRLD